MGNTYRHVRKGILCTGRIMLLEPEAKKLLQVLWGPVYAFTQLREGLFHSLYTSSSLDFSSTKDQEAGKSCGINHWLTNETFFGSSPSLPPTKTRNTVSILSYYFKPSPLSWCGRLSSRKVQKSFNIDISKEQRTSCGNASLRTAL